MKRRSKEERRASGKCNKKIERIETREDQSRNKGLINQENSGENRKEGLKVLDDHPNPAKHGFLK